MISTMLRYVLALGAVLPLACQTRVDGGDPCTASDQCAPLECVHLDNGKAVCLPQPTAREPRSCRNDDACVVSDGQLWPVESECIDGQCRCLSAEIACTADGVGNGFDDDSGDFVLQEETCRCLPRGAVGDSCITAHTCDVGLACRTGECREATGEPGTACNSDSDCEGGRCDDFRDGNPVGICR